MEQKDNSEITQEEWIKTLTQTFEKLSLPFYPTMSFIHGIQIDFCRGARVYIPQMLKGKYRLKVVDLDSKLVMHDCILEGGDYFVSKKKYFINYGIQISEYPNGKVIIQHKFCGRDKNILIKFPIETLGDTLAWFNSVVEFQKIHQCNLLIRVAEHVRPLLEPVYKGIKFVSDKELKNISPYAVYTVAVYHEDSEFNETPIDYRTVPLHHYASKILNVPVSNNHPKIFFNNDRRIAEPYVCIASQASGGVKLWHNPTGWSDVVIFLKEHGYRVIDIDKEYIIGDNIVYNRIPREAENLTGDEPLIERANLIANCDFFIGLGSGLSWLSWCLDKPTVLISGFSEEWEEFSTPYRVSNRNMCHGCFNDITCRFEHDNFLWCPRHANTSRHWECSRGITSNLVINAIKNIPVFNQKED